MTFTSNDESEQLRSGADAVLCCTAVEAWFPRNYAQSAHWLLTVTTLHSKKPLTNDATYGSI